MLSSKAPAAKQNMPIPDVVAAGNIAGRGCRVGLADEGIDQTPVLHRHASADVAIAGFKDGSAECQKSPDSRPAASARALKTAAAKRQIADQMIGRQRQHLRVRAVTVFDIQRCHGQRGRGIVLPAPAESVHPTLR